MRSGGVDVSDFPILLDAWGKENLLEQAWLMLGVELERNWDETRDASTASSSSRSDATACLSTRVEIGKWHYMVVMEGEGGVGE